MRTATLLLASAAVLAAQAVSPPRARALVPLPRFRIPPSQLAIAARAQAGKPFSVAGEYGAIFGDQSGAFEVWLWPVKILSHFSITAEPDGYAAPVELAAYASSIEVTPAMTTITYSHAAFTVKQRMYAFRDGGSPGEGVAVLFEIDSAHPLELTFRFHPEMARMWPAPGAGPPSVEWSAQNCYRLTTKDPRLSALVAIPRTHPGPLPLHPEQPQSRAVELKLRFDPQSGRDCFFPLVITRDSVLSLGSRLPELYSQTAAHYDGLLRDRLAASTPDRDFDRALRWAEVSIDQGQVRYGNETGLIAGYYTSGDSARPGYGWFFGRDALWTSYAVNSYGDFALTRRALEFLIRRQRADGKIMHEFSQTAGLVDWTAMPYFYASADATPLFVMAIEDYVATSGDTAFLRANWEAVRRAYAFTREHDSDGDGIYENTEGTGWVESWPPGMPHQEIYLAALDQQSCDAMSRLAARMDDLPLAARARRQAALIQRRIEAEYYRPGAHSYAFSRNAGGTLDSTDTIFPAVAWWTGRFTLARPEAMLNRWASPEFSTDWGTRDVSSHTPFYDPVSYHQGSVWPLFTGWVSLAEYRAGRALSGYAHLMQNADLTWEQDPGGVTELLSGESFQPLGRSCSHQIWSSAMVLTPALRGLFGLDWDAPHNTLRLAPQLPAEWDSARLTNVPLGGTRVELEYRREGGQLLITAIAPKPVVVCLAAQPCSEASTRRELRLDLPPVEVGLPHGLPAPGARTAQLKVIDERLLARKAVLVFEAAAGSEHDLPLRVNRAGLKAAGAVIGAGRLRIRFPQGAGYQRASVTFSW